MPGALHEDGGAQVAWLCGVGSSCLPSCSNPRVWWGLRTIRRLGRLGESPAADDVVRMFLLPTALDAARMRYYSGVADIRASSAAASPVLRPCAATGVKSPEPRPSGSDS